ncbi:hypothetical protein [Streptomyces ossamyceticus]|uniref:hypothetical protein n=1 Tax=Streptomyces ossamyceticus TaxID=249581 RepID=UPI00341B7C66
MALTNTITKTPTTHTFRVSIEGAGGYPAPDKDVQAAYFQQDEGFTVFKDAEGGAVYSVKNSVLLTIERLAPKRSEQTA